MVEEQKAQGPTTTTSEKMMQKFAEAHPNQENVGEYYNDISHDAYDKFIQDINFTDPFKIAEAISKAESAETPFGLLNLPRDSKVFDVGQGTGLLGKLLTKEGFTNIEGADASSEFVKKASETGWYTKLTTLFFGRGVEALPADMVGKQDLVMASGVYLDGHIPASGFDDMHAMCKTGGHFITSMRAIYNVAGEEHGYKDKLDELIAAGKF